MLAKAKARIALLASLVSITLLTASGCSAQQAPSSQAPDNSSSPSAISVSSVDKDAEYAERFELGHLGVDAVRFEKAVSGFRHERDKMRQRNSHLARKYGLKRRRERG